MAKKRIRAALGCVGVVMGMALLVGCQTARISEAEAFDAAEPRGAPAAESAAMADSDRKFLSGPNWSEAQSTLSRRRLLNVDPADRKFYGQAYFASGAVAAADAAASGLHPADVKFVLASSASEGAIHSADIKFYLPALQEPEGIHAADVKFYLPGSVNGSTMLPSYLSLHPADRKFLASE